MTQRRMDYPFLPLRHGILQRALRAGLSGTEWDVFLLVSWWTEGYRKETCTCGLTALARNTTHSRAQLSRALISLVKKKLLVSVSLPTFGKAAQYRLNIEGCCTDAPVASTQQVGGSDRVLHPCNAPVASTQPFKESIQRKHSKERHDVAEPATSDPRHSSLKEFVEREYLRLRGCRMITDAADWTQFSGMLHKTHADPAFGLEQLQAAWTAMLTSSDTFHQRQGHPLRYWATNLNAFMRVNGNGNGAITGPPGSTSEARTSRGERHYIPRQ